MLKIRLMRIGTKKRPFYRIVAVDERAKRTGGYLELLGTYNPLTEPHEINLKQERIDHWIKQGAQLSDGFLRITGKAPKRPPRKPKKEKKEPSAISLPAGEAGTQSTDKTEKTINEPETPVETQSEASTEEPAPEETSADTSDLPAGEAGVKSEVAEENTSEVGETEEITKSDS